MRFLTWIAAGSHVDRRTSATSQRPTASPRRRSHLSGTSVEAFARAARPCPSKRRQALPGIAKARAALARKGRLDHRAYLRGPKVFGFFGVYRRLAVGADLVDSGLMLKTRGEQLLRAWEQDHPEVAAGFVDRRRDEPGGYMAIVLRDAARQALLAGQATHRLHGVNDRIVQAFRLDDDPASRAPSTDGRAPRSPEDPAARGRGWHPAAEIQAGASGRRSSRSERALRRNFAQRSTRSKPTRRSATMRSQRSPPPRWFQHRSGWASADEIANHREVRRATERLTRDYRTAVERLDPFGIAPDAAILLEILPTRRNVARRPSSKL